jgi:hypothetical protein
MFLSVFGFQNLDKLDLTKSLTGTGIYIISTEMRFFKNDFAYLILFIGIFYITTFIFIHFSRKRFK